MLNFPTGLPSPPALPCPTGRTMYKFSFKIPPYYTLLVRSLTVLEGIALASDPNYKVGYYIPARVLVAPISVYVSVTGVHTPP